MRMSTETASSILWLSLTLLGWVGADGAGRRLPPPWGEEKKAPKTHKFRIVSEVYVVDSGRSFLLQESAAESSGVYRLDITDKADGKRETFLSLPPTKEMVHYKPYTCYSLNSVSAVNERKFNKLFPSSDQWLLSGVGSLWSYALKKEAQFTKARVEGEIKLRGVKILRTFNRYTIEKSDDFPYKIKFFFQPDSTVDWDDPKKLSTIILSVDDGGTDRVVMRIRILEFNSPIVVSVNEHASLFSIPVGYGCTRKLPFKYTSPIDLSPALEPSAPQTILLQAIGSVPTVGSSSVHEWQSQEISLRISMGQIQLNEKERHRYHIVESSANIFGDNKSSGLSRTTRRTKRVWKIGKDDNSSMTGSFFEFDEGKGECIGIGEGMLEASATFLFKMPLNIDERGQQPQAGIPLDLNTLEQIFSSTDEFQLIAESSPSWTTKKRTLEKRLECFRLRNKDGDIVWVGPVSIIREHVQKELEGNVLAPKINQRIDTTIVFFNAAKDKMLATIRLSLIDRIVTRVGDFHRRLDVSPCIDSADKHPLLSVKNHQSSIKFSVELISLDDIPADLDLASDHFKESIYEKTLVALSTSAPNEAQLDLLQIVDFEVETEDNSLEISARVLKVPSLVNFKKTKGFKFAPSASETPHFLKEIKSNEFDCAESCANYKCQSFGYCRGQSTCNMNLVGANVSLALDSDCSIFSLLQSHLNSCEPMSFLSSFRQRVLGSSDPSSINSFKIDYQLNETRKITYTVSSVQILTEEDSLLDDLPGGNSISSASDQSDTNEPYEFKTKTMDAEYEVMFTDRSYPEVYQTGEQFPLSVAHVRDYKHCQALCSSIDCLSFSFCKMDQTCVVSQLHTSDDIQAKSNQAALCVILAREYLSKFYAPEPQIGFKAPMRGYARDIRGLDKRSCASSCVGEDSFSCGSFQLCNSKLPEQTTHCYLFERGRPNESSSQSGEALDSDEVECEYFERSSIAEFDRVHSKSIKKTQDGARPNFELRTLYGVRSADDCANECKNQAATCLGFDVCRSNVNFGGSMECTIAIELKGTPITERLENSPECTTFIRHLDSAPSGGDGESWTHSGKTTNSFILITIGSITGYVASLAWKSKFAPGLNRFT